MQEFSTTNEALEAISRWATTTNAVAFGHLRVSHRDFIAPKIWKQISERLTPTCGRVFFVGTELQSDVAVVNGLGEDGSQHAPVVQDYSEFLRVLQKNRADKGRGPGVWKQMQQPQGWAENDVLPDKLLVVLSIEPQMPADCALAAVATIHWAMDISQRPGAAVQVLTMSPEDQASEICLTLKKYAAPTASLFDLRDADEAAKGCSIVASGGGMCFNLWGKMEATEASVKHIVLCYQPAECLYAIQSMLELSDPAVTRWIDYIPSPYGTPNSLQDAVTYGGEQFQLVYLRQEFRAPCLVEGFDMVHILVASRSVSNVYDIVTGQTTHVELFTSRNERLEQISWATRTTCAPKDVIVYLDAHDTVEEFINAGHDRRRLDAANSQLGGFLGAAAGLSDWNIDQNVLSCFARDHSAVSEISNRMFCQGIIACLRPFTSLSLRLPPVEACIFQAVLPILDYDYRLAYPVSHSSSGHHDAKVNRTKIQLAALLHVGLETLVDFEVYPYSREALVDGCWGYTKPMSAQGITWLALGLWKMVAKDMHDFNMHAKHERGKMKVPDSPCFVDLLASIRAALLMRDLNDVFRRFEADIDSISIALEDGYLNEVQQLEVQNDLLHAYVHQLVECKLGPEGFEWRDVSTKTPLKLDKFLEKAIDKAQMERAGGGKGLFYGVYHGMGRDGDKSGFLDWTWIPTQLVDNWASAKGTRWTIHDILDTGTRPPENYKEKNYDEL
ncbi:hypothetical protein QQX98_000012 [Neonectria punicea]|uniref:Uncharacterized protein n=1 Tax=Neonectria punicea TaxID=979145 RepID=A0ABR1HV80_9HYPO